MGDYHIHHRENVRKAYTESFHAKDAKLLAVDDVVLVLNDTLEGIVVGIVAVR